MNITKFRWVLAVIFLWWIGVCNAVVFVDVNKGRNYDNRGKPYVRVVVFDVDEQKFLSISYLTDSRREDGLLHKPYESMVRIDNKGNNAKANEEVITIDYMGHVQILDACNTDNFVVRTFRKNGLPRTIPHHVVSKCNNKEILLPDEDQYIKGDDIKNVFSKKCFIQRWHSTGVLPVKIYDWDEPSNDLYITSLNKDEKGRIGELATELTMIRYGYNKLPARPSDREDNVTCPGFDGIFEAPDGNALFITEAKCQVGERGITANKILKDLKRDFASKMLRLDRVVPNTHKIVKSYMDKSRVFMLIYSVKEDGRCQIAAEEWVKPDTDNVEIDIEEIIARFGELSIQQLEMLGKEIQQEIGRRQN